MITSVAPSENRELILAATRRLVAVRTRAEVVCEAFDRWAARNDSDARRRLGDAVSALREELEPTTERRAVG